MSRPDKLPEWALQEIVEEIVDDNGKIIMQSNVYEPPENKKQYGVLSGTPMGRQWFNWLFRYINKWIVYLDAPSALMSDALPNPDSIPRGKILYVIDKSVGGSTGMLVFNDGKKWRQVHNGKSVN